MLVQELRFEGKSQYEKLLRITPQGFDAILGLIQDYITKRNTNMHDSIPASKKIVNSSFFPSSIHKI